MTHRLDISPSSKQRWRNVYRSRNDGNLFRSLATWRLVPVFGFPRDVPIVAIIRAELKRRGISA